MHGVKRTWILAVSAVIFLITSIIPSFTVGDFVHAETGYGLPIPWIIFSVTYARMVQKDDSFAHGRIEHVDRFEIQGSLLPLALGASLIVGSALVSLAIAGIHACNLIKRRFSNR